MFLSKFMEKNIIKNQMPKAEPSAPLPGVSKDNYNSTYRGFNPSFLIKATLGKNAIFRKERKSDFFGMVKT